MKPSQRIQEIFNEMAKKTLYPKSSELPAILQYLDEKYEKNKPCEHSNTTLEIENHAWLECRDCHVLLAKSF